MLFSQLSGYNPSDVTVLITPRLFNDRARLIDAPQPIERLGPKHRDPARIGHDRDNYVVADLDVDGGAPAGLHPVKDRETSRGVAAQEGFDREHPIRVDVSFRRRARVHGALAPRFPVVDAGSRQACSDV